MHAVGSDDMAQTRVGGRGTVAADSLDHAIDDAAQCGTISCGLVVLARAIGKAIDDVTRAWFAERTAA